MLGFYQIFHSHFGPPYLCMTSWMSSFKAPSSCALLNLVIGPLEICMVAWFSHLTYVNIASQSAEGFTMMFIAFFCVFHDGTVFSFAFLKFSASRKQRQAIYSIQLALLPCRIGSGKLFLVLLPFFSGSWTTPLVVLSLLHWKVNSYIPIRFSYGTHFYLFEQWKSFVFY